ncbi:M15 family metallopeptidase [Nocardioides sp. SYSU D00038]|uniref:M15 family metallopeptidase n=1 Tax=Nocardioides sp. SYSU D00038 TaxID=2812554 RepID=UPI0019673987|nr:M15 family metallopeptidase [Nocardioides sp. SYSU D00038]
MGMTHALGAAATAGVLAVASACSGGSAGGKGPAAEESTAAASPSASASPSSTAAPADPEHAVDPPGPRDQALASADFVIYAPEPLSDEMVERIGAIKEVTGVEPFAMTNVVIENESYNLAAVDPATYRLFTPLGSADTQQVWERVAGGEIAVARGLERKLPIDQDGYLKLGAAETASRVHVGAYAEQAPQVDAVVNEKWAEELGMTPGNALLVSTGIAAPQKIRRAIQRIVGDSASVQSTDAVARYGLDPQATQTAVLVGSVADVVGRFTYTVLGGGRIAPDPAWVRSHISTEVVPILGRVTCNKYLFPQLRAALQEVQQRGLADKIHPEEYAGCYYPRFIAGSTKLSNHSFGLALDLNVPGNGRGTVGDIDRDVVAIFKKWGFGWGGDWRYTDPMHFEMVALVNPG